MKQFITKEQWNELNEEKQVVYLNTFKEKTLKLPSIGRMIEFLQGNLEELYYYKLKWSIGLDYNKNMMHTKKEICDTLWLAVKFKLRKLK